MGYLLDKNRATGEHLRRLTRLAMCSCTRKTAVRHILSNTPTVVASRAYDREPRRFSHMCTSTTEVCTGTVMFDDVSSCPLLTSRIYSFVLCVVPSVHANILSVFSGFVK